MSIIDSAWDSSNEEQNAVEWFGSFIDNRGYTHMTENKNEHFWKFNEGKIIKTIEEYIKSTYEQHYNDEGKNVQTLEKLRSDRVSGFLVGNIQKYLDRYDKKGTPRADLLKAAHYMIFLLNHENIYD